MVGLVRSTERWQTNVMSIWKKGGTRNLSRSEWSHFLVSFDCCKALVGTLWPSRALCLVSEWCIGACLACLTLGSFRLKEMSFLERVWPDSWELNAWFDRRLGILPIMPTRECSSGSFLSAATKYTKHAVLPKASGLTSGLVALAAW